MQASGAHSHVLSGTIFSIATVLLLLGVAALEAAASSSVYHPEHIENARENLKRHAWAQTIVRSWEHNVSFAMQQDREFFEELISELTFGTFYGQNCPACVEAKRAVVGEYGLLGWTISNPDQLTCKRCGTVYPSEQYPETGVLECPRMGQTFTYYQTPGERALGPDAPAAERAKHALGWLDGGKRVQMTSFSGMIRGEKNRWAWAQMLALAKLYAITGEIGYAERAAWILDRFARVFPNYLYHSYDGSYADLPPAEVAASMGDPNTPSGGRFPPEAIRHAYGLNQHSDDNGDYSTLFNGFWGAGRLFAHAGSDSAPLRHMTVAYDLIRDARYPDGTLLLDDSAQKRIVDDLLIAGAEDTENWTDVSNNGMSTYAFSAALGTLLQQPDRVRHALSGLNEMLSDRYHFDGFYAETPHYASWNFEHVGALLDGIYGYSDPEGYQPPDGQRLENLNPFTDGDMHLVLQAAVRMIAPPGNRTPTIGDTIYTDRPAVRPIQCLDARLSEQYSGLLKAVSGTEGNEYSLWYRPANAVTDRDIRIPVQSEWFPGWHVGVLRGPDGDNETALYLNGNEHLWTKRTGHRQVDILSIIFYAFGRELASDRGYFSGSAQVTPDGRPGQAWVDSTLSHNLVVVDNEVQRRRVAGSNLGLFGVTPEVEVIEASAHNVYPQCDQYRRTCALATSPEGTPYVVDFFRVHGGSLHQYSFNCNGTMVATRPHDLAIEETTLSGPWVQWLDRPRAIVPDMPLTFAWSHDGVNMDLMLLNRSDTVDRVIIADAPGWRTHQEAMAGRDPIQQILAEKRAETDAPLATTYATVMVPYQGNSSPVLSASMLADDPESGVVAAEVRFADRTDYIISTLDYQERQIGPITVAGRFAYVSVDTAGQMLEGYLLAGTHLDYNGVRLELEHPTTALRVASTSGSTYHLAEPLADGIAASGGYLIADGPASLNADTPRPRTGFEIESVGVDSITVRDYPVPECDEITILNSAWVKIEP